MDLKNKKVTIIGLARSGFSLSRMISRLGGQVKISEKAAFDPAKHSFDGSNRFHARHPEDTERSEWDEGPIKILQPFGLPWPANGFSQGGQDDLLDKDYQRGQKIEMEFGGHTRGFIEDSDLLVISPGVSRNAEPILWAKAKGIPVVGEIELAWQFCPCPVIAVTGSNGKTTVVTLIKKIFEQAQRKVCACGNIGLPFSDYVLDLNKEDTVVLEISSFQLESIAQFRPHVAVLLNFSQNHLDRHADLEEYFQAKKRIFENQTKDDFAVLNYQYPRLRDLAKELKARVCFFNNSQTTETALLKNPNYLAAMEVARVMGIGSDICHQVFESFRGVEHRLEWVRQFNGVDYINDSKSTTAEAGRWALESASKPIVMICGGRDKNIDFLVLRDLVGQKVKKMVVIGEAREKIRNAFQDVVSLEEAKDLEQAVIRAREHAVAGDVVIFSPMCTSFDMFLNFEERGRVFKTIVQGLS